MPDYRRLAVALGIAVSLMAASWSALASAPLSIYLAPSAVEYEPNARDATKVILHGAFVFLGRGGGLFSMPECGYMYFSCKPGEEAMCRMQWGEIEATIARRTNCIGFGQMGQAASGILRYMGEPLGNPDPWDIGMGTRTEFDYANCKAAVKLNCGMVAPPADLSVATPDMAEAPSPDLTTAADLASAPADLPVPSPSPDLSNAALAGRGPGSCAVGRQSRGPHALAVGLLLCLMRLLRRRHPG